MFKKAVFYSSAVVITISFLSCSKPSLDSDVAKYSYAAGFQLGGNIKKQNVDLDMAAFTGAIKDAIDGKESRLKPEEVQAAMMKMSEIMMKKQQATGSANLKTGDEFLKKNKEKPGVVTTVSGLQYRIIKEGTGRKPGKTDVVQVHYRGKLTNGTEFDSSYERKEPVKFPLDRVIPGWTEGIQLMKVGSQFEFVIPSNLAYGEQGAGDIPPNSVLVFEVELLDIPKK
ncbi:MAG: FKBP-type peptidyl-prolyl cis-trans isomerase [Spirochaetes bacterium]|nr:FKBP-type peptidyl-prolyl cis-trans isomerase [Spirochaetota bacterium]